MRLRRKLGIIFRVLKGEEFVPRAEGSTVNDDTVVIVNILGHKEAEAKIGKLYNPEKGIIELDYKL
ncbi:MAG: hypothetical protein PHX30_04305 [Candidatus Pacebacteria bacterium]|nr:hypothetical protein [Candidatus Paceibacterota bacterium]